MDKALSENDNTCLLHRPRDPQLIPAGHRMRLRLPAGVRPDQIFTLDEQGQIRSSQSIPKAADVNSKVELELDHPADVSLAAIGFFGASFSASKDAPASLHFSPPLEAIVLSGVSADPNEEPLQQFPIGVTWEAEAARATGLSNLLRNHDGTQAQNTNVQSLYIEYSMPSFKAMEDLESSPSEVPVPVACGLQIISNGGTSKDFKLMLRPGINKVFLYQPVIGGVPESILFTDAPAGFRLLSIGRHHVECSEPPSPLPADAGTIFLYPRDQWRQKDFELFSWSLYPEVLLFDMTDYQTQARFFKRLAFFVEKQGFQGRLLTNQQLEGRHGYNAHNYNGNGLADFFQAAADQSFVLNPEEELLREVAESAGIIRRVPNGWQAGPGGVLSISQDSPFGNGHRLLLLSHEAMHGVFYANPSFADFIEDFWHQEMNQQQREFWRIFMQYMHYSPQDEYLVINELQAYLLQYPHRVNQWYFAERVRSRLTNSMPAYKPQIDAFYQAYPDFFTASSWQFNQKLFTTSGIIGGDVRCLIAE